MKTNRFIAFMCLAALFAGCGKDDDSNGSANDGRIRIFAEKMVSEHGGKVLFNPAEINNAQWVAGESINLNGNICTVESDGNGGYALNLGGATVTGNLYAIYPATTNDALGNNLTVSNNMANGCAVDIHSLALNFHTNDGTSSGTLSGTHDVYFPMTAYMDEGGSALTFHHLTGGLKLTLSSTSAQPLTRLVVTATKENGDPAIYKDLKPTWDGASSLPGLPEGEVGNISGDQNAQFISSMELRMNTAGSAGVTIPASGSITFCIPMLAQGLKILTIEGYNGNEKLFSKSKSLGEEKDIERNKMYATPEFSL